MQIRETPDSTAQQPGTVVVLRTGLFDVHVEVNGDLVVNYGVRAPPDDYGGAFLGICNPWICLHIEA